LGRIEELRCCGSQEAGETQRQREPGRGAASAPEPPVKGSTAPQAASQATEPTASQAASTAPTEPAPRPRPRR
jgi:hypothetical protein